MRLFSPPSSHQLGLSCPADSSSVGVRWLVSDFLPASILIGDTGGSLLVWARRPFNHIAFAPVVEGQDGSSYPTFGLLTTANDQFRAMRRDTIPATAQVAGTVLTDDFWHPHIVTYTGNGSPGTLELWQDGVSQGTDTQTVSLAFDTFVVNGYERTTSSVGDHPGGLAWVVKWSVVLSQAEIEYLSAGGYPPSVQPDNLLCCLVPVGPYTWMDLVTGILIGPDILGTPTVFPSLMDGPPVAIPRPSRGWVGWLATAGVQIGATADGFDLGDTFGAVAQALASMSDGVDFGDSESGLAAALADMSDGVDLGDTESGLAQALANVTDGIDFGDTFSATATAIAAWTEGVVFGDTQSSGSLALTGSISDGIKLGEALSRVVGLKVALTDGLALGDSEAAIATAVAAVVDGLQFGDTESGLASAIGTWLEGAAFGDVFTFPVFSPDRVFAAVISLKIKDEATVSVTVADTRTLSIRTRDFKTI